MASQNLVRFPPTRHLDADYGAVLANTSKQLCMLQQFEDLLSSNQQESLPCHDTMYPPHQTVTRAIDSTVPLSERVSGVRDELTRQVTSLQRCLGYQQQRISESESVIKTLLTASRTNPAGAADILWTRGRQRARELKCRNRRGVLECAYNDKCRKSSLPFSRFCLKHQSSDPSQLLYPSCTGIDSNSLMRCNQTVLDIFSDASLCPQHSSEATPTSIGKRKSASLTQLRLPQKKAKINKMVREKRVNPAQSKVGSQVKTKVPPQGDVKPSSTPQVSSSWTAGSEEDTPSAMEDVKPAVASSKSLDDLLTLDSTLTARLPKLDLLPLKADIGEIMMAGEDDSGEELL